MRPRAERPGLALPALWILCRSMGIPFDGLQRHRHEHDQGATAIRGPFSPDGQARILLLGEHFLIIST